jgi:hypothetical protein
VSLLFSGDRRQEVKRQQKNMIWKGKREKKKKKKKEMKKTNLAEH